HPDAQILAGGTDIGLWVTKHLRQLGTIIYIGRVHELARIEETETTIEIGAGATYSAAMDIVAQHYPDMGELFRRLGSVQVRNAGTIGGNIANGSPIGDAPPPLIAAGATLNLRRDKDRRSLPLEDFFIAYGQQDRQAGEFVERITLPKPDPATRFRTYKITKRFDQDISAVCAAFSLRLEGNKIAHIRIAYGGVAATPKRAEHAERALAGQPWSEDSLAAAIQALDQDFQPITDMRASAHYRRRIAGNLLRKFFIETTQPNAATRVIGTPVLAHV
ncbi:MAG: FAD binding domain-containing protein, partial [Alphaproteobacteria bacterium]